MAEQDVSSKELMEELQGREDLSNLINGDSQTTDEMTSETRKSDEQDSKADNSEGQKDQEEKKADEGKKSNFQKAMEKKNRTIAEKDELIASKDQKIADLEKQLKEAQERDDFDDIDEKEEHIQNLKNDLSYEKNRKNEIMSEKSRMKERILDQMMDDMSIDAESQKAIKEFAKKDAYKGLEPEDIISLYNGKVGMEYDQQELNKKSGGTSVLGDNRVLDKDSIDKMDSKAMEQELARQIKSGNSPF